jgi:hypothetical protein
MSPIRTLALLSLAAAAGACAPAMPSSTAFLHSEGEGLRVTGVGPGRVEVSAAGPLHLYVLEVRPETGRVRWPFDVPAAGSRVEGRMRLAVRGLGGGGRASGESLYCNRPGERMTYVSRESQRPVATTGSGLVSAQARPVQARGRVVYCTRSMEGEMAALAAPAVRHLVFFASPVPLSEEWLVGVVEAVNARGPLEGRDVEAVVGELAALFGMEAGTSLHLVRVPRP